MPTRQLELDKAWYEKKTAEEADLEVTAAAPLEDQAAKDAPECIAGAPENPPKGLQPLG